MELCKASYYSLPAKAKHWIDESGSCAQQNKRFEFAIYSLSAESFRHMLGAPGFEAFSVTFLARSFKLIP